MNNFIRRFDTRSNGKEIQCFTGLNSKRRCIFNKDQPAISNPIEVENQNQFTIPKALQKKIRSDLFCKRLCPDRKAFKHDDKEYIFTKSEFRQKDEYHNHSLIMKWNKESSNKNNLIAVYHQTIQMHSTGTAISISGNDFLLKIGEILFNHYSEFQFSATQLANEMHMSISQVNRKLNSFTGYPAGQLIRLFRLNLAAELLRDNPDSISDICYSIGFSDAGYFSRAFKNQFGCSPSIYKAIMLKKSKSMRQ